MADVRYAIDTGRCTYLLDSRGVCCSVTAPAGQQVPEPAKACVGAQFVASLDVSVPGGLLAELRVGANGLFVRPDRDGKYVLLRTATIVSVSLGQKPSHALKPSEQLPPRSPRAVESKADPGRERVVGPTSRPAPYTNKPSFPSYQGQDDEESLTILRPDYTSPAPLAPALPRTGPPRMHPSAVHNAPQPPRAPFYSPPPPRRPPPPPSPVAYPPSRPLHAPSSAPEYPGGHRSRRR